MKQKKPEFWLSKEDWTLSRDKWKGIIISLKKENETELLSFFETDCGYCDEAERSWEAVDVDARGYLGNKDYCKYCPLRKNRVCLMGDSDGTTSYGKAAQVIHAIERGGLDGLPKTQMTSVMHHSQKILDAILASKPKRFRPVKD